MRSTLEDRTVFDAAVKEIGRQSRLELVDVNEFVSFAVETVGTTLEVDRCSLFEFQSKGTSLLVAEWQRDAGRSGVSIDMEFPSIVLEEWERNLNDSFVLSVFEIGEKDDGVFSSRLFQDRGTGVGRRGSDHSRAAAG